MAAGAAAGKFLQYETDAPTMAAQTAYGIQVLLLYTATIHRCSWMESREESPLPEVQELAQEQRRVSMVRHLPWNSRGGSAVATVTAGEWFCLLLYIYYVLM